MDAGAISTFFNEKPLNWLGLVNTKPITEDYVPLVPWLGVLWWGMAGMQWWLRRAPSWQHGEGRLWRALAVLGRWSLSYYMLHQPVLLGLLWLLA